MRLPTLVDGARDRPQRPQRTDVFLPRGFQLDPGGLRETERQLRAPEEEPRLGVAGRQADGFGEALPGPLGVALRQSPAALVEGRGEEGTGLVVEGGVGLRLEGREVPQVGGRLDQHDRHALLPGPLDDPLEVLAELPDDPLPEHVVAGVGLEAVHDVEPGPHVVRQAALGEGGPPASPGSRRSERRSAAVRSRKSRAWARRSRPGPPRSSGQVRSSRNSLWPV